MALISPRENRQKREAIFSNLRTRDSSLNASVEYVQWIDSILTRCYQECYNSGDHPVAVFALGSYGRVELNPHSDIDILIVYGGDERRSKRQTKQFMQQLWDTGLEIGHQFVSPEKCCDMAFEDPAIRTTLLEMRFVCGNHEVKAELKKRLRQEVFEKDVRNFSQKLLEDARMRHIKYGRSPQLLEPHVKEGVGALRDLHVLLWLFRINREWENIYWIKENLESSIDLFLLMLRDLSLVLLRDAERLREDFRFLFWVRSVLHQIAGRKNDLLEYGLQKKVAAALGYSDGRQWQAVEKFMRDYYRHARHIQHTFLILSEKLARQRPTIPTSYGSTGKALTEEFLLKDGEIHLKPKYRNLFAAKPHELIHVFWLRQHYGSVLSESLREHIYYAIETLPSDFCADPQAIEWFLRIMNNPKNLAETLRTMHELRIFDVFLPEFSALTALAQHDLYHFYSADEHTLIALENVTNLPSGSRVSHSLQQAYLELPDKRILFLAILFHDVGKAKPGDHTILGVEIARKILARWQLNGEIVERILFLVRNHQKMEQVAFRRNISELNTIRQFAQQIGDELNLKLLYLLSYADLSAVNPSVWTEWKGILLMELFTLTLNYLRGERQKVAVNQKALRELADEISRISDGWVSRDEAFHHLSLMPVRYMDSFDEKQILRHIQLIQLLKQKNALLHLNDFNSYIEVTVVTTDQPFCLADICGVISVHDLNIFSAQIFTRRDGLVLDVFRVVPVSEHMRPEDIPQEDLTTDLQQVLAGNLDLPELFRRHKRRWKRRKLRKSGFPDEINFDNRDTAPYTIIDVFTDDSIGLLYRLALAMSELKLNIHAAKIATRVDQVADSFYVSDSKGRKIEDPQKQKKIKAYLLKAIHREF